MNQLLGICLVICLLTILGYVWGNSCGVQYAFVSADRLHFSEGCIGQYWKQQCHYGAQYVCSIRWI